MMFTHPEQAILANSCLLLTVLGAISAIVFQNKVAKKYIKSYSINK